MSDARTGPMASSSHHHGGGRSHGGGSGRRRERHRSSATEAPASDTKSCGGGGGGGGSGSGSGGRRPSGLRALQDLVSDTRTFRYGEETSAPPLPMHASAQQQQQQQQQQQPSSSSQVKGDNFEDFMKYLGLAEGSAESMRARRQRPSRDGAEVDRGRAEFGHQLCDDRHSNSTFEGYHSQQLQQPQLLHNPHQQHCQSHHQQPQPHQIQSHHLQHQQQPMQHHEQHHQLQQPQHYQTQHHHTQQHQLQQPQHHQLQHHQLQQPLQHQQSLQPPSSASPAADDFAEEDNFFQLISLMMMHADKAAGGSGRLMQHGSWNGDAVIGALRRFSGEFGECVCRFHRKSSDAFPFYQPEMLRMLDLLTGTFSAIGDAVDSELRLFTEQLRGIHLNMRLFLRPDETLAEVDDASLSRLLLAYSEQVDRDLRALPGAGAASAGDADARFARRRAASLAGAVSRYARTVERRRQLVLGRVQGLAASVMAFVSRCPPGGGVGDGGFRKAVVDLFDSMIAGFPSLGNGAASAPASVNAASMAAGRRSRAASPTRHSDDDDDDDDDDGDNGGGFGDSMSMASRQPLPPPPASMLQQHTASDSEEPATVGARTTATLGSDVDGNGVDSDDDVDGSGVSGFGPSGAAVCSPEAAAGGSDAAAFVGPQEALSLQLMERLECLLASILPNERVNSQEFKTAFNGLSDWWRRVGGGGGAAGCDKRVHSRMASIRAQFECAQRHRAASSSGVKRICSEADTAWDLLEVARLMLPQEERTAALMSAHTAPEWRDSSLALVDSALATLYLYQSAQDASVLSMRLKADLQRLTTRLSDCGPVPLLCLLRLRLVYLRARQYADLLRAHPQGCLILELAQTHRTLRRDEYLDGSGPLGLTVCVPLNDYKKFCQHVKDLRVLSFEACAPVTEKTSLLMKASCLKKIEKCCQCSIELHPPAGSSASSSSSGGAALGGMTSASSVTSGSPVAATAAAAAAAAASDDALTMGGGRRKPQLAGGTRPNFSLIVRPDPSHGRANAAMRMICDIVGPASIGERVKYRSFHLAVSMPHNYKPVTVFADTSRPLTC